MSFPLEKHRAFGFVAVLGLIILTSAHPQDKDANLNRYYRFPLSVGVEYQSYNPTAPYGSEYNIFELALNVRWPIPPLPIIQPMVKAGMISFDSLDRTDPYRWDNTHWFGGLGVIVAHRFAKNFEIGGEISASLSHAVFGNLDPDSGPVGTTNIIAEAGLRIGLNPSYNFNVDFHPSLKYFHSFSPLTEYNGLIFGIGFSGSFRFGRDPDSPQSIIRNIRFTRLEIPPVFAAMQSHYVRNPVGSVTLENTDRNPIKDVNVSFYQKGYMDSPTLAAVIPEIEGGAQMTIDLLASYNAEVFAVEGVTPLTGEVIVSYTSSGRAAEQRQSVSYDLHDKTALIWNDDRKVAAFITPSDSALRNYSSHIRQVFKDETVAGFSANLQTAMQIYTALETLGCIYQVDPRSPFTEVQNDPVTVDSISLPRDTLKRITGDCDDLTVLYCSLLETVGIESGFITVPGHIYAVFNTGVSPREYEKVHPDRDMSINIDGELWVPVEITMIGRDGFLQAWRTGMDQYMLYDDDPSQRGVYLTAEAQKEYRAVGLRETDLGLQYGDREKLARVYEEDMTSLINISLKPMMEAARKSLDKKEYNRLGIKQVKFKMYDEAESSFRKALDIDPNYLSANVNLSNIQYIRGRYDRAADGFTGALRVLESRGLEDSSIALQVLLNISKAMYAMEEFDEANTYYRRAEAIDDDQVQEYAYLAQVSVDSELTARASEVRGDEDMLFIEEE